MVRTYIMRQFDAWLEERDAEREEALREVEELAERNPGITYERPPVGFSAEQVRSNAYLMRRAVDQFLATNASRSSTGNAERLELRFGDDLRSSGGEWVVYDGKAWRRNKSHLVVEMMKSVNRSIADEAQSLPEEGTGAKGKGPSEQDKHRSFAVSSSSKNAIYDAMSLAKSSLTVESDVFDNHPHLLNTPSGIVDLTSGQVMPHDKGLMLTGITAVDYDKDADSSAFEEMMIDFCRDKRGKRDQAKEHFYKVFLGYSLRGDNREKAILIITGDETDATRNGNNGKTTIMSTIASALGGDIITTIGKNLICREGGREPDSKARLPMLGRRIVYGAELSSSDIIDAASLKLLTGEEKVRIKSLYVDEFEGKITATPIVYSNVMPKVNSSEAAIWDRIYKVAAYTYYYPQNADQASIDGGGYSVRADKDKMNALRSDPAFLAGVLKWLVEGAIEYHQKGLPIFAEAKSSLDAVKRDSDPIMDFYEQCLCRADGHKVRASDLYTAYLFYCRLNSADEVSQHAFGIAMNGRGHTTINKSGYVMRTGVAFNPVGLALAKACEPDQALMFTVEDEGKGVTYPASALPPCELRHFAVNEKNGIEVGRTFGPYRVSSVDAQGFFKDLDPDLVAAVMRSGALKNGAKGRYR